MKSIEWFVDGYPLRSGRVRDVEDRSGWHRLTGPSGENLTVPNRSGEIFTPKRPSPGTTSLRLWLANGNEQQLLKAWDDLVRICSPLIRQVVLQKRYPDGEVRQCRAELSGGVAPVPVGRSAMRAQLTFTIPSGMWESATSYSFATTAGSALPQRLELPELAPSTAPMENALIRVVGPITNPQVGWTNPTHGVSSYVKYNGTVPAGGTLSLDSGTWEIAGSGFTPNKAAVVPTGARLLSIQPSDTPGLTMTGIGGGATTRLLVDSKRSFLA